MRKSLKEIAKEKNKEVLIEEIVVNIPKENIEVYTKEVLIESINDGKVPCRGVLRNVPVTRYTENANGRIYGRALWENVVRSKVFEGSYALAGHPEDDGCPDKLCGIWKNLRTEDKHAIGDIYCVGPLGGLMMEAIQASGKIGFSTCGFGDFLEDSKTVNPESYEYQRTDWVLEPSQQVYATQENMEREAPEPEKKDKFIDSEEKNNKISENDFTNKYSKKSSIKQENKEDKYIKENITKGVKNMENLEKLYEANHKNQIKQLISEAREMVEVDKAIKKLSDLTVVDFELKKEVDNEIENLRVKLAEQKKNAEKNASEAIESVKKLTEALEVEKKKVTDFASKYNKAKSIVDSLGAKENSDPKKLKEEKQKMAEELKVAKENIRLMSEDIKAVEGIFASKTAKKLDVKNIKDVKQLCEDTIKRNKDLKFLYTSLKEAEKRIKSLEKIAENYGYIFEQDEVPMKKDDEILATEEDEDEEEKLEDDIMDSDVVPEDGETVIMSEPGDEIVEEDEYPNEDEVVEDIDVDTNNAPAAGEVTSLITSTEEPDTLPEDIDVDTNAVPEEGEMVVMDEDDEEVDDFPVEVSPEEAEKMEQEDSDIIPEKPTVEEEDVPVEDEVMPWEEEDMPKEDEVKVEQEDSMEKMPWEEDDEPMVDEPVEDEIVEQEEVPVEDEVVEEEEEEEDPKDKMAAVRAAKEESIAKRREINYFVTREIKKNSALKDVELALRKSNSLMEAMQKIDKFLSSKKDKPVKVRKSITESITKKKVVEVKKPSIHKYVFKK